MSGKWQSRTFEHSLFLYHEHKSTALFLAQIARAQNISDEDGLYCPSQIRHLDLDSESSGDVKCQAFFQAFSRKHGHFICHTFA